MSLVASVLLETVYVIDVVGAVAVAAWVIVVLTRVDVERDDE